MLKLPVRARMQRVLIEARSVDPTVPSTNFGKNPFVRGARP